MENIVILTIIIVLLLIGAIWAILYNFYMSWFKPSAFLEGAANAVKDWWPFASYFRNFYASSKWLWITRIWATFFLLGILFLVYKFITVR